MGQARLPDDPAAAVGVIKQVVADATGDEKIAEEAADAFAWSAAGGQARPSGGQPDEVPPDRLCDWRFGEEGAEELMREFEKE